jgi:hypothetical protein
MSAEPEAAIRQATRSTRRRGARCAEAPTTKEEKLRRFTRSRAGKLLVVLVLLLPGIGLQASPASASTSNNAFGVAQFQGTAYLGKFPCPLLPPYGTNTPCNGSFQGQWEGNLSGTWSGRQFDVVWQTTQNTGITANFTYFEEACTVPEAGAALGVASGTGTAKALSALSQVAGVMTSNGIPQVITDLQMDFSFSWLRAGNGAVITLTPVTFKVWVASGPTAIVINSLQRGTADFVPRGGSTPTGAPTCTTPLPSLQGDITGTLPFVHNP